MNADMQAGSCTTVLTVIITPKDLDFSLRLGNFVWPVGGSS